MPKVVETKTTFFPAEIDPAECPFREFRDMELSQELWGLGPAAVRYVLHSKNVPKPPSDYIWVDDQTQPLPRSVRYYLHGWVRAEELAETRWEADLVVCDENDSRMNVVDVQVSHAQVLLRSSFCRRVLSICFVLERVDSMVVEHQWENFICNLSPDWRAKYHIYSPGMKPGGGAQHRPVLSKNGCYLVRLFHLGAWRCIWVSDQVPVDASDSPLLPFSPQVPLGLAKPQVQVLPAKQIPTISTGSTPTIHLWPLLICKALLKLFAPDMNADQDWPQDKVADEEITDFDIFHALTGCMTFDYNVSDSESLWKLVNTETPAFSWDGDDETLASTIKSKGPKKPTAKDTGPSRRCAFVCVTIDDTQYYPAYALPGFSPGQEMTLLVTLTRDVPIKKPLPEPDVALWKYYRWVDWAKRHGLYESFECPRTRYFKVNALMKLSYAPHLLDLQSTESITYQFRTENTKTPPAQKDDKKKKDPNVSPSELFKGKEEYKDWILVQAICKLVKQVKVVYYPSLFQYTSASNNPPIRQYKNPPNRAIDIIAPKCSPLYLQLDNSEENVLKISIAVLHPRIMLNCGVPLMDYIEPAYLFLERFKWFEDREIPVAETFLMTRIYNTVQVSFEPGRHFFRVWVHSRMNWHIMLMSESNVLLGTRDLIQSAAALECPWVDRYLNNLGMSFINWIRVNRSNPLVNIIDKELFTSYQPDLTWDPDIVGYKQCYIHWMFRQALQSLLKKNLSVVEFRAVSVFLRHYFSDPDFGLPPKPEPPKSLREIVEADPCDCEIPVAEEVESVEEEIDEQREEEKTDLIDADTMNQLLTMPKLPVVSQICELATEEVPCGILKEEREKMIRKHEAATVIQSFWRGYWARQCLQESVLASSDDFKLLMDFAFGNHESLRNLMNEFFGLFPGTKSAYSIASGLTGVYGSLHFTGTTPVTPSCKWIPFFQGVFFCHAPVKVHFDIHSSIHNTTFAVFNNDTGCQMPQAFNAHVTFDFQPNTNGYTVMGHGSLNNPSGINYDAYWQLTVLTSIIGVFHVCNNELDVCTEIPIQTCYKLHVDEMFLPNRRNILGGIIVAVTKNEAVSFRAATTCPGLELLATLRTTVNGEVRELGSCAGTGELYWPYIKLKATTDLLLKKKSTSHANLSQRDSNASSTRSVRSTKVQKPISAKAKTSAMKIKDMKPAPPEPKQYSILVTAPTGWPLNLEQWTRVDEVRNSIEMKMDAPAKKPTGKCNPTRKMADRSQAPAQRKQPTSAKEKDKEKPVPLYIPVPGDAYTELECSLASNGGAAARRDDDMDVQFYTARRAWDAKEPGRNARGAQIRKEFRTEYLEALAVPPPTAVDAADEEPVGEFFGEEEKVPEEPAQQGPTPVSESGMMEMEVEVEEEMKYLLMPDQLRDKFIQLQFLALCMKDKLDQASVLVTPDIAEAAKQDRFARIEAAIERMNELQHHNEEYVIKAQRRRGHLLETLFVESQWSQELIDVLEERDDAIVRETLLRSMSALRKKQEQKQGKK